MRPQVEVVWNTKPVSAHGDDKQLTHVMVDTQGEVRQLDVAGLFYAIGHDPNTKFLGGQINLDQDGYVTLAEPGVSTATNVEGVFACGDVVDKRCVFRLNARLPPWLFFFDMHANNTVHARHSHRWGASTHCL